MKIVRTNVGIYRNKKNHDWEWQYRFVMDDFGNLVNIERQFQCVVFFYADYYMRTKSKKLNKPA